MQDNCSNDLFQCVFYMFIIPILLVLGMFGSAFNLVLMSGPGFRGLTFFYLRALSLSDMVYLVFVMGYLIEIMWLGNGDLNFRAKYYLTHWDIILGNTFITTSGYIILLLTMDRYRAICHPTRPRDATPGLYIGFALISGFLLEPPKFLDSHIVNACVEVTSHNNHTLEGGECQCGTNVAMLGTTCRYQVEEAAGVIGTFPWVTYSLLINLLTKILPSILMIIGNIKMIRRYHQVTNKIGLNRNNIKQTSKKHSKVISKRDHNLMKLLFFLGLTFFIGNFPMAFLRICIAFGYKDEPVFKEFRVLVNTLEICFASSNFFFYCFCNVQIRRRVGFLTSISFISAFVLGFSIPELEKIVETKGYKYWNNIRKC